MYYFCLILGQNFQNWEEKQKIYNRSTTSDNCYQKIKANGLRRIISKYQYSLGKNKIPDFDLLLYILMGTSPDNKRDWVRQYDPGVSVFLIQWLFLKIATDVPSGHSDL